MASRHEILCINKSDRYLLVFVFLISLYAFGCQQFYDGDVYDQTFENSFTNMDDNDFSQGVYSSPSVQEGELFTPEPSYEDDVQAFDQIAPPQDSIDDSNREEYPGPIDLQEP